MARTSPSYFYSGVVGGRRRRPGTPPLKPISAASSVSLLLGESHLRSPCPAPSPWTHGSQAADGSMPRRPSCRHPPQHLRRAARGDRPVRMPTPCRWHGSASRFCGWARLAGRGRGTKCWPTLFLLNFRFYISFYNYRNSYKLLKYEENAMRLKKIQNKFCWNPL
jgi:hypothetical protein